MPSSKKRKAEYVLSQTQFRNHHCHWPGCNKQVPPAMWGCREHWFTLPQYLRKKIWNTYMPGQEIKMNPSRAYLEVAEEVQQWIKKHLKCLDVGLSRFRSRMKGKRK